MGSARSYGFAVVARRSGGLPPLDRHVLDDVGQVCSLAQPLDECPGIALSADVLRQPRHPLDEPIHEAWQVAALALVEILEVERHQHDRPMREDVRAVYRARTNELQVVTGLASGHEQ